MSNAGELTPDFIEIIKHSQLFDGVEPDQNIPELEECRIIQATSEDILITMGDENTITYFVLSGSLSIHLETIGKPAIRHVGEGETIGELSVLGETTATAFVVVQRPSHLLVVPREIIWSLIRKSALIAQNLLFILTDWIISDNERFVDRSHEMENLKGLSQQDGLTGLYNRRMLDNTLNRVYTRSQMSGHAFSVIMLDVDHFKKYNDLHGHQGGDCALVALASALMDAVRPIDFVGRYGGEEFTIILPDTTTELARVVAERVRKCVEKNSFTTKNGAPLPPITISLGITSSSPGSTIETIWEQADKMLYKAKSEGRNRYCS